MRNNDVSVKVLVGKVKKISSAVQTYSPVSIFDVQFTNPGLIDLDIPKNQTVMVYVIDGELKFHNYNKIARKGQMIYFDHSTDIINLTSISITGSYLVLAEPLNESVVRYGPFVTNTERHEASNAGLPEWQNGNFKLNSICLSLTFTTITIATELLKFIDLKFFFIGIVSR